MFMLQKVDRDIAYVAMAIHICSKCFICFFRRMLQMCLFGCCICFTHMLQLFYLDVAHAFTIAFQVFSDVFTSFLDASSKCSICLQMYVANVSKVDRVLLLRTHLPQLASRQVK
jgi:hypothetical protein